MLRIVRPWGTTWAWPLATSHETHDGMWEREVLDGYGFDAWERCLLCRGRRAGRAVPPHLLVDP